MRTFSSITAATFYHLINLCACVAILHACVVDCTPGDTSDAHTGHADGNLEMPIQRDDHRDYGKSIIPGDTLPFFKDRYKLMDAMGSRTRGYWDSVQRSILTTGSQITSDEYNVEKYMSENRLQRENTLQRVSIYKQDHANTQNADGEKRKDRSGESMLSLEGNVGKEIEGKQQMEVRWRHTVHELTGERSRESTHSAFKVRSNSGMNGMPSVLRGEILSSDLLKGGSSDKLIWNNELGTDWSMLKYEQLVVGRKSPQREPTRRRRRDIDPSANISTVSMSPELDITPGPANGIDSPVDQSGTTEMSGQLDPSLKPSEHGHYGNKSELNSGLASLSGEGKMVTTAGDNEINDELGYDDINKVTVDTHDDSITGALDSATKSEDHGMESTTGPHVTSINYETSKGDNSPFVDNESTIKIKGEDNLESPELVTSGLVNIDSEHIVHVDESSSTEGVTAATDRPTPHQSEWGSLSVTVTPVIAAPVTATPVVEEPVIATLVMKTSDVSSDLTTTSSSDISNTLADAQTSEHPTAPQETVTITQLDSGDNVVGAIPLEGKLVDTVTTGHQRSSLDSVVDTETTTEAVEQTTKTVDDVTTAIVPDDVITAIVPDDVITAIVPDDVTTAIVPEDFTTAIVPDDVTTAIVPDGVTTVILPDKEPSQQPTSIDNNHTMITLIFTQSITTALDDQTTALVTITSSPVTTAASIVTTSPHTFTSQAEGETKFEPDYQTDPSDVSVTSHPDQVTPASSDYTTTPNSTQAPIPGPDPPERALDWGSAKQTWQYAWEIHIYSFGALFGLLAMYSVVCVVRLSCVQLLLPRGYFLAVNIFMFLMCATRSFYMLYDGYNSGSTLHFSLDYFLYSITFPCLTSAFSLLVLSLLRSTNVQLMRSSIQNVLVLSFIIVIHFALSISTDVLVSVYTWLQILQFVSQVYFVIWGLVLFLGYIFIFRRLYSNAVKRQKNAAYGLPGEGWVHTSEILTKFTVSTAVKISLFISISGLVVVGLEIYAILDVYKTFAKGSPEPWPWWSYHTGLRIFEFLMALSLCYVASLPFTYRRTAGKVSCGVLCSPCAAICCCGGADVISDATNRTSSFVDWHDSGHGYPGLKVNSLPKENGYSLARLDNKRLLKENIDSTPVVRKTPVAGSASSLLIIDNGVVRFQTDDDVADVINGYESDHSDQKRHGDSHNMNTFQLREGYVNPYSLDDIRGVSSLNDIRGVSNLDNIKGVSSLDDIRGVSILDGNVRDKSRKSSMTSSEFFRMPSSVSLAESMDNELEKAFESFKLDTSTEVNDQQLLDNMAVSVVNPRDNEQKIINEIPRPGFSLKVSSRSNFEHNHELKERPGSPDDASTPLIQRSLSDSYRCNDFMSKQHSSQQDTDSIHSGDQEVDELIHCKRRPSEGQGYQAAILTSLLKSRETGSKENIDV